MAPGMTTIRSLGIALMLASALLFSTAGIFTKGVAASAWQVIFWRAVFSIIFTTGIIGLRGTLRREFLQMGGYGWAVAIIGAIGTAAFLTSFKHTSVANVALIYSTTPLIAALLVWVMIREAPGARVVLGAGLGIAGIMVILSGSVGQIYLLGDMLALIMALVMAILFAIYRIRPETPSAGPVVVSCLLLLPVSGTLADPGDVPPSEVAILAAFGAVFALASILMLEGAKRLPSGQAGLLSTAETPFAIVLAWMILSEWPGKATLAGGVLVMIGVIIGSLKERRNQPGSEPSST